jgi:hypothetical protein
MGQLVPLQYGADKLPPGFADMALWTHIDATLYIERKVGL